VASRHPYQQIFAQLAIYAPEIFSIFELGRRLREQELETMAALQKSLLQPRDELSKHAHELPRGEAAITIDTMRDWREINHILKRYYLLPETIFDQHLLRREFLVRQPKQQSQQQSWEQYFASENSLDEVKARRRKSTYLLIDTSGTTAAHHRLLCAKAIAMEYILRQQREAGNLYLRFFNHSQSDLFSSRQGQQQAQFWSRLLEPRQPFGGTNLHAALEVAGKDVENHEIDGKTDVLILSDGLTTIDSLQIHERNPDLRYHFVIIGNDKPDLTASEWADLEAHHWQRQYSPAALQALPSEQQKRQRSQHRQKFMQNKHKQLSDFYARQEAELIKLAELSRGTYLQIADLPADILSLENIQSSLATEMRAAIAEYDAAMPVGKKEKWLEKALSLQNILNQWRQGKEPKTAADLQQSSSRLRNFIQADAEISEILKYARITLRREVNGTDEEVSMADLFRLVFVRLRSYFMRHKQSR
jgi:nicotinic acid mononucleotide adenylyltransferase